MNQSSVSSDPTQPLPLQDPGSQNRVSQTSREGYAICIRGQLDLRWSDWFEGMTVTPTDSGDTILSGPVADQAALHGLLAKVRDLNLTLITVNRIEPTELSEDQGSKENAKGRTGE